MRESTSVLIVERSGEVREVLRTALQRRGWRVFEAAHADAGLELARRHPPDLVVLDLDGQPRSVTDLPAPFSCSETTDPTPVIFLGAVARRRDDTREIIAKPYHYQPLISKIEQLLERRASAAASRVA